MVVRCISPQRPQVAAVVESYSGIANGDVVSTASTPGKVAAATTRPRGIMVDAVPATNPPTFYRLAVTGDWVEDTGLTSQTEGAIVYSDGDGTYSTTRPTGGSAGDIAWALGFVRESDTSKTIIEMDIQPIPEA